MRRKSWHWIALLLVAVAGTGFVTGFLLKKHKKSVRPPPVTVSRDAKVAPTSAPTTPPESVSETLPPPIAESTSSRRPPAARPQVRPAAPAIPKLDAAGAAAALKKGLDLLKQGHLIERAPSCRRRFFRTTSTPGRKSRHGPNW